MILILSQSKNDSCTEDILQWISYYKGSAKRINGEDLINNKFTFSIDKSKENNFQFDAATFEDVNVVFYRRYKSKELFPNGLNLENLNYHKLKMHINKEFKKLYDYFINDTLKNAKHISSLSKENNLNKIVVLKTALESGLLIPETIVTNNKSDLKIFLDKKGECIVKPIGECEMFFDKNFSYKMLTERITSLELNKIPSDFLASLIQENIIKAYELRVFYFFGEFYAMAIFSQNDEQTKTDFRNYNSEKPNRTVPYKLPGNIENKLRVLMQKLDLETGSIDLIKSTNGEYYFLEINPNGQFGMTSYPCNYNLEEKVALKLIQIDEKRSKDEVH